MAMGAEMSAGPGKQLYCTSYYTRQLAYPPGAGGSCAGYSVVSAVRRSDKRPVCSSRASATEYNGTPRGIWRAQQTLVLLHASRR